MRGFEPRRLLVLEPGQQRYRLRLLEATAELPLLSGEALCHALLREDPEALVIARGPMPFLSGNKATVGYLSPLTGLPHYSFVGGRAFSELLNLGLDALVFAGAGHNAAGRPGDYVVVSGRAPRLSVEWKPAVDLPPGQRSAFHWLLARELDGQPERGSVFAIGSGAHLGFRTANLAVDGLYHAGRGGAGLAFARFVAALVLRGQPMDWQDWFGPRAAAFWDLREGEFRQRLERYTGRLSQRDGGTVTKLQATGQGPRPSLPSRNAQRVGYDLADLGAGALLRARRAGQTGCHWCQVNCRHWHWLEVDYTAEGRDRFLDDFEPTYAIFAMLDLRPTEDSQEDRLRLLDEVDRRIMLPIEQMGCDVIDVGLAVAALFEGLERDLIPAADVPPWLQEGPYLGDLESAARVVQALRAGDLSPALQAAAHGPQGLAERYPALQDALFTSGRGTLGNAGHANALWTFLMPLSRYFGHYVGQFYKIAGQLPPPGQGEAVRQLFQEVVGKALERELLGVLCNSLSACAFTFVLFSEDGQGMALDGSDLLVRMLACYGLETSREELEWFAESFWSQSIAHKLALGWLPPSAADYPHRVFEVLSLSLGRPAAELRSLMDDLIGEWKRQAAAVLYRHGQAVPSSWG